MLGMGEIRGAMRQKLASGLPAGYNAALFTCRF